MKKIKTYGSFFALENSDSQTAFFSKNYKSLNTGRNAFEYILLIKKPNKVYLPSLSCYALYTPLERLNINFEFYNVDNNYEPIFDYNKIKENDYFLYINYYGIKNSFSKKLSEKIKNLILDNTQAFYGFVPENIPTFNSLRKFFGVPDGALLFNIEKEIELETDSSINRFSYLIKRLELPSNDVYSEYRKIEEELDKLNLKWISESTKRIFNNINHEKIKGIRTKNFQQYHLFFKKLNKLNIQETETPHFYPLFLENGFEIKKAIVKKGVFTANFWPNVLENKFASDIEKNLVKNVIPLPIDQRYNKDDISHIINIIDKY